MGCRLASSIAIVALTILLLAPHYGTAQTNSEDSLLAYVGTYTSPTSKGIYAFRFNPATGQATTAELAAETINPSFLAIDPTHKFLYAANEVDEYKGEKSGAVSAFAIDRKSGKLTFLNQVSSRGQAPCYVSLDKTGKYVLVANYNSGSVAVFPALPDGKLGEPSAVVQHTATDLTRNVKRDRTRTRLSCPQTTASRLPPIWASTSYWSIASTSRKDC